MKHLLLVLLAIPLVISAQDFRDGYVVKPGNDTVRGLISYRSARSVPVCEFKVDRRADVQQLTAEQLVAFEIDRVRYESIMLAADTMPKGKVFMAVLAKGAIDLYRYSRFFFLHHDNELIGLPEPLLVKVKRPGVLDGSTYMKKDSRFVAMLNQLVQECALNANLTGYDEGDMVKLINAYNTCKHDQVIVPRKKSFKANFKVFGGFGASSMTYNYKVNSVDFDLCLRPSVGIGTDLSSPILSDRMFFTLEVWMSRPFYQGYDQRFLTGGTLRQDFLIDLTYVKMPVGLRYHFTGRNTTPYISGGLAFGMVPRHDFRAINEIEFPDGSVYSEGLYSTDYYFKTNTRRLWIGAGYLISLGKLQMFLELRGDMGGGFMGDQTDSKSTLVEANILGGLRF